jgi:integrase/recombinase XerD
MGELLHLDVEDLDLSAREAHVREGKGACARIVPLSTWAGHWLSRYLCDVRPKLLKAKGPHRALFVCRNGRRLQRAAVSMMLKGYARAARIEKPMSAHRLRHACATHLLRAGADVRGIQCLLGHASLHSTMIYTRVVPVDLQKAHAATHPLEVPVLADGRIDHAHT